MYKYSRKERIAKYMGDSHYELTQLLKDLLAQKEDRKECKHIPDREVGLNVWSCKKCRCCFVHKSTPSPLEEIEKVKFGMDSNQTFENFYDKINEIIRTVNKLIKNSPIEANSGDMEDRNDSSVNDEMKENYKLREEK